MVLSQGEAHRTAVLSFQWYTLILWQKKKKTDTMYLVFAKVFDKVDHEILLEKIKNTK